MMREMEQEKRERRQEREAAERKRAALNQQLHVPDHTDVDRERQLRRVATRGGTLVCLVLLLCFVVRVGMV